MISRLLGLEESELSPVLRLGAVHAMMGGAMAAGDATVQALFLSRAGADQLPKVLLVRALVSPILAWLYTRMLRPTALGGAEAAPPDGRRVLAAMALVVAAVIASAPFALRLGPAGALGVYAVQEVLSGLLTIHWGVYLLEHLAADRARRGVATVYAASRAGAALAGALLAPVVMLVGAASALWFVAFLYAAIAPLAFLPKHDLARPSLPPERIPAEELAPSRPSRPSVDARALAAALVAATAAMVLLRYTLRYQQQSVLDDLSEDPLARLLGLYAFGANLLGIVLQIVVTGRLLDRFGVARANLAYASAAVVAQGSLALFGGVGAALLARFADGELKHALKTPVSPLFYEAFPKAQRAAARALVLGLASPVAQVLAALLLHALVVVGSTAALVTGAVASALYLGATVWQNRAYVQTLAARAHAS